MRSSWVCRRLRQLLVAEARPELVGRHAARVLARLRFTCVLDDLRWRDVRE